MLTGGGSTGEEYGNNPFGEFVNLGKTIAQFVRNERPNTVPAAKRKPQVRLGVESLMPSPIHVLETKTKT